MFAQAPPPLDPKVHTWSKEWDGLNHVLWEAGALALLALLVLALLALLVLALLVQACKLEWDGLNHVLWEAGALALLALLVQECKC